MREGGLVKLCIRVIHPQLIPAQNDFLGKLVLDAVIDLLKLQVRYAQTKKKAIWAGRNTSSF